jgi:hypothetical protein
MKPTHWLIREVGDGENPERVMFSELLDAGHVAHLITSEAIGEPCGLLFGFMPPQMHRIHFINIIRIAGNQTMMTLRANYHDVPGKGSGVHINIQGRPDLVASLQQHMQSKGAQQAAES